MSEENRNIEDCKIYVARSRKCKKPSPEKARYALKNLIDIIFAGGDENLISQAVRHMPVLLDYFNPSVASMSKIDALAWAQLATNIKSNTPYMQRVFAYSGDAIGYGGHRMHVAKGRAAGMPDGTVFFPDGSTTFTEGFHVPPCNKIIPSMEERESVSVTSSASEGLSKDRYYKLTFSNGEFGHYNALYFDELNASGEKTLFTTRECVDKDKAKMGPLIGIDTATRLGLLMPMRHG